ncbi:MAG TPA: caspase family protein [Kofleriaceae bacterium]|nr:caspase family protein [Kofleriaceae bacterium]
MTTIFDSLAGAPAVHAFVIGIGDYPFLKDGDPERRQLWGLGQLTSPPLSALAFAAWLDRELALPAEDPRQPGLALGSLELLVSQPDPQATFQPKDAATAVSVDRASMDTVKDAFKRWLGRCNRSEQNLALFFFSGHGVAKGGWQGLLLDRFNPNDPNPFEEVIDFDRFALGMDQCLARRQCFLIDACRNTPPKLKRVGGRGQPLIDVQFDPPSDVPRDVCIIRATAAHQTAYGIQGEMTRFTSALLRALEGAGCSQPAERWEVRTDSIVANLNALLKHDSLHKHLPSQEVKGPGDDSTGFVFHVPKAPKVPIVIGCTSETDTARASLMITYHQQTVVERGPEPTDWETELALVDDEYSISASFQDEPERTKTIYVRPPLREVRL